MYRYSHFGEDGLPIKERPRHRIVVGATDKGLCAAAFSYQAIRVPAGGCVIKTFLAGDGNDVAVPQVSCPKVTKQAVFAHLR
jgi:hypothetical protein